MRSAHHAPWPAQSSRGALTGVPVHPNALGEENDAFDVELSMLAHGVR